jgi:hypothetical protein
MRGSASSRAPPFTLASSHVAGPIFDRKWLMREPSVGAHVAVVLAVSMIVKISSTLNVEPTVK